MRRRRLYRLPVVELETRQGARLSPFTRASASKNHRRPNWTKYALTILPSVIFGVFTVVFTLQQNSSNKVIREQDRKQAIEETQRATFDNYIDMISERLLSLYFNRSNKDHLLAIRVKTLTALRYLDPNHKREILFFLYENKLIVTSSPPEQRLDLDGVDLSGGVQFRRTSTNRCIFTELYLPRLFAFDIIFDGCELEGAVFDESVLTRSQFINCSVARASFIDTILHETTFHNGDLDGVNFSRADLTRTTFFDGIFQQTNLNNTDLFGSNITNANLFIFANESKANLIFHTRFHNGSFSAIDSIQFIKDNGAEQEVTMISA